MQRGVPAAVVDEDDLVIIAAAVKGGDDRLLKQGDVIELYINDEFFGEGRQDLVFLKVPDRIQVVYEDQNILLVDKKPGLVVHEDDDNTPDTLINRILHYLYNKGEYQPDAEQSFVPALCNRIDRNTGGIVIAAKNAQALRILNQKVKDRELTKLYLCLVHGMMQPKSGTLRDFLLKDSQRNQVRVFKNQVPGSKTIITSYRTLRTDGKTSLLEVDLKTGRTHQIRVHFSHLGYPLAGDFLYNPDYSHISRQALHSHHLRFRHPITGEEMHFTAPVPEDMLL